MKKLIIAILACLCLVCFSLGAVGCAPKYRITYKLELDGAVNKNNPYEYKTGDEITLNPASCAGYEFIGWVDVNGQKVEKIPADSKGELSFTATWSYTGVYTIEYVLQGGTNSPDNPTTFRDDEEVILKNATKDNYEFRGWLKSKTEEKGWIYNIPVGTKENYVLYADWEYIGEYLISYELDGGTNSPDNPEVYSAKNVLPLIPPTKDGYKFVGWKDGNGNVIDHIKQYNEDNVKLYAKWVEIFNVSYELDGGENNERNITCYTSQDKDFVLLPTVKVGYKFIGWRDGVNGMLIDRIRSNAKKNYVLYAVWEELINEYSIKYTMVGTHTDASGNVTTLSLNSTSSSYLTNIAFGEQFNNLMMVECSLLGQTATLSEYYLSNWYFLDKDGNKHYVYRNSKSFVPPVFDNVAKEACVDGILTLYPTIGCNWFGPY